MRVRVRRVPALAVWFTAVVGSSAVGKAADLHPVRLTNVASSATGRAAAADRSPYCADPIVAEPYRAETATPPPPTAPEERHRERPPTTQPPLAVPQPQTPFDAQTPVVPLPTTPNQVASSYGTPSPFNLGPNMLGDFQLGGAFSSDNLTLRNSLSSDPDQQYGNGRIAVPINSHTFKYADNESPFARNRLIYDFNYFNHVGDSTNIARQMFGFELATPDGAASIALRLPYYTVDPGVQSSAAFPGGSVGTYGSGTDVSGAFGDLITTFKYSLFYDPQGSTALSVGAAVTANTGASTIGGVTPLYTIDGVQHVATVQPYVSYFEAFAPPGGSGAFVQGFLACSTPFNVNDASILFTDAAMGYIFRRSPQSFITAVVPTVEVHVNTPLYNREHTVQATADLPTATDYTAITGTVRYFDQVNFTVGTTVILNNRTSLAAAYVIPVTQPKAYEGEFYISLNRYFRSIPFLR